MSLVHRLQEIDDVMDYYGDNGLENWLIDMSEIGSFLTASETLDSSDQSLESLTSQVFGRNEEIGGVIGAIVAGGIYSLSAPVVLVDGPSPVIDAVWLAGFLRTTRAGYEFGSFVGSLLD
jgi:hypothetical protein